MILTIILFLQMSATSKAKMPPAPVWEDLPVRHLHCPKGYHVQFAGDSPLCTSQDHNWRTINGYDSDATQEFIQWEITEIVPKQGELRIVFPGEFLRRPGCEVIDKSDAENRLTFSDETKDGFTIHAHAGHKLWLNCRGVLQR